MGEFQECLEKGRIARIGRDERLVKKELEAARTDLEICKESLNKKATGWAAVQAYYACFHAARALLFEKGFREKSHYCLSAAIKELYAKQFPPSFLSILDDLRALREEANYETSASISKEAAESALEQATRFVDFAQVEIVVSKSKLTEKDAAELARKVDEGLANHWKEFKDSLKK